MPPLALPVAPSSAPAVALMKIQVSEAPCGSGFSRDGPVLAEAIHITQSFFGNGLRGSFSGRIAA